MQMLIVSDDPTQTSILAIALHSEGRAIASSGGAEAAEAIQRRKPDVIVLAVLEPTSLDTLRSVAAIADRSHTYVVAVLAESLPGRTGATAIAAGAHYVIWMPYHVEELRVCVEIHHRLRQWLAGTPRAAPAEATTAAIGIRAWDYLGNTVVDDLEAVLAHSAVVEEAWLPSSAGVQLATIAMTFVSVQVDLCISIVADEAARQWFGSSLLGDPAADDDAVGDVMRELANTAGGALKRAAALEGPVLATGIPSDQGTLPVRGGAARSWTFTVESGPCFAIVAEPRRRGNRRVQARRLVEGMVVVKDVRNKAGLLLLPSGTRLTSTTAERLSNMLDAELVDVCA